MGKREKIQQHQHTDWSGNNTMVKPWFRRKDMWWYYTQCCVLPGKGEMAALQWHHPQKQFHFLNALHSVHTWQHTSTPRKWLSWQEHIGFDTHEIVSHTWGTGMHWHWQLLMTASWHSLPHHPSIKPTLFHSLSTLIQHTLAWGHSAIVPTSLFWDCAYGMLPAGSLAEAHKIWLWKKKRVFQMLFSERQDLFHALVQAQKWFDSKTITLFFSTFVSKMDWGWHVTLTSTLSFCRVEWMAREHWFPVTIFFWWGWSFKECCGIFEICYCQKHPFFDVLFWNTNWKCASPTLP